MKQYVPQYLHLPGQVLWFDSHEVMVLGLGLILSLLIKNLLWIPIFIICGLLIRYKRKKPRGFLLHLLIRVGLVRLKGYPLPTATKFYE